MSTVSELLTNLKNTPGVVKVSDPSSSTRDGLLVQRYRVLVEGEPGFADMQTIQMVVIPNIDKPINEESPAFWIGKYIQVQYNTAKSNVINHLNSLDPKPLGLRERLSNYDPSNQFSIVDAYYKNTNNKLSRKSMMVLSDGAGGITSYELEVPFEADKTLI